MPDAMRVAESAADLGDDIVTIADALGAQVWIVDGLSDRELRHVAGAIQLYVPPRSAALGALAIADLLNELWQLPRDDAWNAKFAAALLARLGAKAAWRGVQQPELVQLRRVV